MWFPWTSRAKRKADVERALDRAAKSRRAARRAARLAADLRQMEHDELARAIVEGLGRDGQ